MPFRRALFALSSISIGIANASNFSFVGTFSQDDQLEVFQFTAPSADVILRTWSYAGGMNAAGQSIAPGGFDPIVSLFDATGGLAPGSALINFNDDGTGVVDPDPVNGNAFDSLLEITTLDPGHTYALVLSQADNGPNGPTYGDGFHNTGSGDFTPGEFGCGASRFCDASPAARNGSWAVDILGVGTALDLTNPGSEPPPPPVPEPAMLWMLTAGMCGVAWLRRGKLS